MGKRGEKSGIESLQETTVQVAGHTFSLRTADSQQLRKAADWLNMRIATLSRKHPLMKPHEIYLLLGLELSFERLDIHENGKDLLKQTDQLLEWINKRLH